MTDEVEYTDIDECDDHIEMTDEVNPNKNECTVCTGDIRNNIWFVPRAPGYPGRCILDELTYDDVYMTLLRSPVAAKDLARITSDPKLQALAREVKLMVPPQQDDEVAAARINANTLPFYTVLRGNTDGTIR